MFRKAKVIFFLKNSSNKKTIETFKRLYIDNEIEKTNPNFSNSKISQEEINFYENLPAGTILAQNFDSNDKSAFFCLPILSSHISLPVKPGEFIWVFKNEDDIYPKGFIDSRPLLKINHYWLSRVHGSLMSEDVNYTDIQRDTLVKKSIRNREAGNIDNNKNINLPSFDSSSNQISNGSTNENLTTGNLYSSNKQKIKPKAIPRYFPEGNELLLQGSHNATVSLKSNNIKSNPMGAIDIVAGRMSIPKDENNIRTIKDLEFVSSNGKKESIDIKLDGVVNNELGQPENFKSASYYLADPFINNIHEKTNINYTYDASRLFISEKANIDNTVFYNVSHLKKSLILSDESRLIAVPSNEMSIKEESRLELENKKTINLKAGNSSFGKVHYMPSVLLKSNNIRIVARSETSKDNNDELQAGSIRLIKQSKKYDNFACLNLEKNGDIILNGKTIFLGNFDKEENRQLNIEEVEGAPQHVQMHGKGEGLLIGYNEQLSEPLILGKTLESFLKEILSINIEVVNEMKKLSTALSTHQHKGVMPGQGVTLEPFNTNPYVDFSDSSSIPIIERYENIQNNLFRLLSRFAKTS